MIHSLRGFLTAMLLCSVMLGTSGCSFDWLDMDSDPLAFLSSSDDEPKKAKTQPKPDPITALSPYDPEPSGQMGTFGLNLSTYFSEEIKDEEERIARLERVLGAMQRDLNTLAGAVQKNSAKPEPVVMHQPLMPQDKVEASAEPQALTPQAPKVIASYKPPAAPTSYTPPPAKTQAAQPVTQTVSADGITATSLRIGQHANKIRLVIDLTSKAKYSVDLDNGERIMVIELADAKWTGPRQQSFPKTPVLSSYKVDDFNNGKGSIAILQLNRDTKILDQKQIAAFSGSGQRIFIDLSK